MSCKFAIIAGCMWFRANKAHVTIMSTLIHQAARARPLLKVLRGLISVRNQSSQPPPADGELPGIATSTILRGTRDAALRTPGLQWTEEETLGNSPDGGRETRKMNMCNAVGRLSTHDNILLIFVNLLDTRFSQACEICSRYNKLFLIPHSLTLAKDETTMIFGK